jgi:hypothetical protein
VHFGMSPCRLSPGIRCKTPVSSWSGPILYTRRRFRVLGPAVAFQTVCCTSDSDVCRRGGDNRDCAQLRQSDHVYNGTLPNKAYGGPPQRVALVASVLSETGKPAARSASAASLRRNLVSGLVGMVVIVGPSSFDSKLALSCDKA